MTVHVFASAVVIALALTGSELRAQRVDQDPVMRAHCDTLIERALNGAVDAKASNGIERCGQRAGVAAVALLRRSRSMAPGATIELIDATSRIVSPDVHVALIEIAEDGGRQADVRVRALQGAMLAGNRLRYSVPKDDAPESCIIDMIGSHVTPEMRTDTMVLRQTYHRLRALGANATADRSVRLLAGCITRHLRMPLHIPYDFDPAKVDLHAVCRFIFVLRNDHSEGSVSFRYTVEGETRPGARELWAGQRDTIRTDVPGRMNLFVGDRLIKTVEPSQTPCPPRKPRPDHWR